MPAYPEWFEYEALLAVKKSLKRLSLLTILVLCDWLDHPSAQLKNEKNMLRTDACPFSARLEETTHRLPLTMTSY